eukprot:5019295-Prymnesium_polylepis.1
MVYRLKPPCARRGCRQPATATPSLARARCSQLPSRRTACGHRVRVGFPEGLCMTVGMWAHRARSPMKTRRTGFQTQRGRSCTEFRRWPRLKLARCVAMGGRGLRAADDGTACRGCSPDVSRPGKAVPRLAQI